MRTGKLILVWVAALMMVADPASACRWRTRSFCAPAYSQPAYCGPTYYEADCGVTYSESSCDTSVPADCSACTDGVTTNRPADETEVTIEPATPQPTFEPSAPSTTPAAPSPEPFSIHAEPAPRPTDLTPPPAAPPAAPPLPAAPLPATPAPSAAPPAAAPPAAEPPKAAVEDLFSAPAAAPATPETKPAEPAEVEDLFKDPAPATTPAPATEKPGGEVDDLFKDLDDSKGGNKAAASEVPTEAPAPPENKEVEDLFSEPEAAPMSTAVEAPAPAQVAVAKPVNDLRTWTDNTGNYQIRGRLVVVGKTHVRILKESGKYTTVPFGRLSRADLAFVRQQADRAIAASF